MGHQQPIPYIWVAAFMCTSRRLRLRATSFRATHHVEAVVLAFTTPRHSFCKTLSRVTAWRPAREEGAQLKFQALGRRRSLETPFGTIPGILGTAEAYR